MLIEKILGNAGCNVKGVENFEELKRAITEQIPHLILLDINLGDENGLRILQKSQRNKILSSIPIVMITALAERKVIERAKDLGCVDFIVKPIKSKSTLIKINTILRNMEQVSYSFKKELNRIVRAESKGELIAISETALQLDSPIKLEMSMSLSIDSKMLLEDLGINFTKYRVKKNAKTLESKSYLTEVSIIGSDEKLAKKIRMIKG